MSTTTNSVVPDTPIPSIVTGILRAFLATVGGLFVERGYIDAQGEQTAIGAIIVLVTLGWTAWSKYQAHQKLLAVQAGVK